MTDLQMTIFGLLFAAVVACIVKMSRKPKPPSLEELRTADLENARRELYAAQMQQERAYYNIAMLTARIQRLEKS